MLQLVVVINDSFPRDAQPVPLHEGAILPSFRLSEGIQDYDMAWRQTMIGIRAMSSFLPAEYSLPPELALVGAVKLNVRDRWDRYVKGRQYRDSVQKIGIEEPFDLPVVAALHIGEFASIADGEGMSKYLDPGEFGREIIAWATLGNDNFLDDPFDEALETAISEMYGDYDINTDLDVDGGEAVKVARLVKGAEKWAILSLHTSIMEIRSLKRKVGSQIAKRAVGLLDLDRVDKHVGDTVRQLAYFGSGNMRMTEQDALPLKKDVFEFLKGSGNTVYPVISSVYQTREQSETV